MQCFSVYDEDKKEELNIEQFRKFIGRLDKDLNSTEDVVTIENIFKLSGTAKPDAISYEELNSYYRQVNRIT